jgi:ribosomal protein S18 acetylase RimI-like enzyme
MPLTLRRGVPADAPRLADFAARAFEEAFGDRNRPEDLAAHRAVNYGVLQQTRELSAPGWITLQYEEEETLAAFAQVRRGNHPECVSGPSPVELYRFYVDRPFHGQGLARQLMLAVFDAGRELGGETLWLGVWEHNPRAIAFYEKCGFRHAGVGVYYVGPDRQNDRIMVADLGSRP